MDVHPPKNGMYRYWSMTIKSNSSHQRAAAPASCKLHPARPWPAAGLAARQARRLRWQKKGTSRGRSVNWWKIAKTTSTYHQNIKSVIHHMWVYQLFWWYQLLSIVINQWLPTTSNQYYQWLPLAGACSSAAMITTTPGLSKHVFRQAADLQKR